MLDLLLAVRGSAEALAKKPLAVFDCCPSPPLAWNDLTCQALIDCARARIPATIVSMPLAGATAPVTLRESVVQHCAEALSGIVLHQSACPGAPILYGGAPAAFDMRRGTAAMGAMETMMIGIAYAQVGKRLGLPTHGYLVVSDGKVCDYQAGLESGIGAVLGALAGINLISGAGMLDYLLSQSLEKLLLDADAIAMAQRLVRGIARVPCDPVELMRELTAAGSALSMPHTREHHRRELAVSSGLVDRDSYGDWTAHGRRTAEDRAAAEARRLLSRRDAAAEIRSDRFPGLDEIMQGELSRYGSTSDLRTLLGDLMEDAR
jgi:trimethylamine--corrinoid protein Co-methyltransferase